MNTRKRQLGVTLNELVISVSIVSILLGMSAPSYSEFFAKRKVSGAANLVSTFFENVKMESIKRHEFATISYQMDAENGSWCLGAVISRNTQCDCMAEPAQCLIDSVPMVLSSQTYANFNEVQTTFVDGFITFDPIRGILTDSSDSVLMEINHSSDDYRVVITVNATGRVRKCTPADYELVGYPACI